MAVESIEAVVFDLGGVLIDWNPRYLYDDIISDKERLEHFLAEICSLEWNARMDRGVPFDKAIRNLQKEHPDFHDEIGMYFSHWDKMLGGAINESVTILEELAHQQMPLYSLTNWSAETFPIALERYSFFHHFKGIVVSGKERMAKPEIGIFSLLLDRYRLAPESTLFVDDQERNVQAARLAGMQAITFTSSDQLRGELKQRGLLT